MKKILAFTGSNSSRSINLQLLNHITGRIQGHEIKTIHLTDYELPIYSADIELERGIPVNASIIKNQISQHEGLVITVNEHNRNISAFFKNILDWLSRLDRNFLAGKKILLMSTSPGARGGAAALEYCKTIFPRFGGQVVQSFSFPSFRDNFQDGKILNEVLELGIEDVLTNFSQDVEEASENSIEN
ncbi:NADPH-dependent FMN reductase [Salegentibacter sediminis]|uniref:NADPH-dependent FMN reductase n=1 Tax=Salegentibacter sediminis TaxID=1930251 RepID=UPI0009C0D870|nr:NAD(P)H-dependent oxidoreductase [Salegentibacter sediminis]